MNLYPWLVKSYKSIIHQHAIKKAHHALLIKTPRGIGASDLIWFIGKWLLCLKPIGIHTCDKCHGCQLMISQNHPDLHYLNNDILYVDDIRMINEKIFKHAQQGGNKVIIISDIHNLTESAVNAFLKTLEEPPKNTWFFLINYNGLRSYFTLYSRCLLYKLFLPKEIDSVRWLKNKTNNQNISYITALRINDGAPISAKKFINGNIWIERKNFYQHLFSNFKNKNLLSMLYILNQKNSATKIHWICLILFDCIKFNLSKKKYLTNIDQIELIQFIACNYNNTTLDSSIRTWMHCKHRLLNIPGVNYELLLIEQILRWEQILHFVMFK